MDLLIEAAMDVFAHRGFEGAATRDLARAADVALSAISYHFGGKAELYRATAERAANVMIAPLAARLNQSRSLVIERPSRADCLIELQKLVESVADIMLAPGHDCELATRFSMRELVVPGPGSQIIKERVIDPIMEAAVALLRVICGPATSTQDLTLKATALFGPITLYRILYNQSLGMMTPIQGADVQRDIRTLSKRIIKAMVV